MSKLADVAGFASLQLESRDMDPAYPVLKERVRVLSDNAKHRYVFLYLAYYNIASAERAFHDPEPSLYPTGTERRNLRTLDALTEHWNSIDDLVTRHGGWRSWLTSGFTGNPEQDYLTLRDVTLRQPWGNGRWAAYKGAEVLQKVLDYNVVATDMGNDGSSGPLSGLESVFGPRPSTDVVRWADSAGFTLQASLRKFGVDLAIDELETVLCNWHSLEAGDYYSGHDIDLMQEQILQAERLSGKRLTELWTARRQALPVWTLGELNGYEGVDKTRKRAYAEAGLLLDRSQSWRTTSS